MPKPASRRRTWPWIVGVGVGVVLLHWSCGRVMPSYHITSGAMLPTLALGDHVWVDATAYASFRGELERGDVIVFRYPIDPSQQFIKRVIGLPGDEVTMEGRRVSITPAGAVALDVPQRRLEQACDDPGRDAATADCAHWEETIGERAYVIRYELDVGELGDRQESEQRWTVPPGHLMVIGDNRRNSHDSRHWMGPVEPSNAEDPDEERPMPFLPVELVVGRAGRIWWPLSRWQAIR